MEILLEHELAVARDEHRVLLRCIDGIHRHVDDCLNGALDSRAIDADLLDTRCRPAIITRGWNAINIATGIFATWVEIAERVMVGSELEAAAAAAEVDGDRKSVV